MGYQFSMRLLAYITSFVFFVSLVGCNYNSSNSALCVDQILSIKKIPIKPYLGYDEGYDYFLEHTNDADVREDYDRNGYFAYYHYVQTDANGRYIIQESVINYYKNQK